MTRPAARDTVPPDPPGEMRGRIGGVDLARALAIIGMLAVHIGPTGDSSVAGRLYALPHGRASVLFVLVAGVGVALLAASPRVSLRRARLTLLWRAAVLLPLGLALQLLDHGALVILQDYAALFVLAVLAVGLPDRWLLALAGCSAVLGPVAFLWGRIAAPDVFDRGAIALTDQPADIVHGLVLSGPYPLIVWSAPFLLGMWLGRRDLRDRALRVRLLVVGAVTGVAAVAVSLALGVLVGEPGSAAGWDHLTSRDPHSQMPLWVLGATGSAAFVLGGALMAADAVRNLTWPLVASGQLALTLYVGHLIALHAAPDALKSDEVGPALLLLAAFTAVALLGALAWRSAFARGPLETLLRLPGRRR